MQACFLVVLLLAAAVVAGAANPPSVAVAVARNQDLTELQAKLQLYTDIGAELGPGFAGTFFAPSDAAIRNAEKAGVVVSSDILRYHIVPGPPAPVTALNDDQIFVTEQGGTLQAQYTDGKLTLHGTGSNAHITTADIMIGIAEYAVVHVIDNVLLPYIPASPLLPVGTKPQPGTGTVGAASLGGSPAGHTGGSTAPVTGSVGADSLDTTPAPAPEAASPTASSPETSPAEPSGPAEKSPPAEPSGPVEESPAAEPAAEPSPAEGPEYPDLVEFAKDKNLTLLIDVIMASGLTDDVLAFNGTVLAPTNAAFVEHIKELNVDINNLNDTTKKMVIAVLSYHLIPEKVYSSDLENGTVLTTVLGDPLVVVFKDDKIYIQDDTGAEAEVLEADITAGDAVAHIIDRVLFPESILHSAPAPAPAPTPASSGTVLASAAAVAGSLLAAALLL
ncbi:hypothetical protein ABPG77_010451 [Micractinium sp. CCAP 211/92]